MRARGFFITSTLIAVFLVVVMFASLPAASGVPPEAAAGFAVWQSNGCIGCHTLYGQGGAYAPDLTHITSQRGENYLREFFVHPAAFHPDERLMPRFLLTRTETDHLIAFLNWTGGQDAAAAIPPVVVKGMGGIQVAEAPTAQTVSVAVTGSTPEERGRILFSRSPAICSTCHSLEQDIVIVGPSLYGIATRAESRVAGQSAQEYLRNSILHPSDYIVEGFSDVMQKNFADVLDSSDVDDLIAFMMTLEDK